MVGLEDEDRKKCHEIHTAWFDDVSVIFSYIVTAFSVDCIRRILNAP